MNKNVRLYKNLSVNNSTHYLNGRVTENVCVNEIVCDTTNERLLKNMRLYRRTRY